MSTDIQPVADQDGTVVASIGRNAPFRAGPTLAEIEARNARFNALKSSDPSKATKIETGTWSPRQDEELIGFYKGIATLGRNPKPEEAEHVKEMQAKIAANEPSVDDVPPTFRAEYLKGMVPFAAAAIETETGLRFLSRMHAMEKFISGQIGQDQGVYIKCTYEKQGEMSKFDIRRIDETDAVDTTYTEE